MSITARVYRRCAKPFTAVGRGSFDGGELRGLLSERDIFVLESIPGVDREKVHVDEAMSPLTYAVAPSTPLQRVAREMAAHKYGAAVVMEGPHVVGVFTTVDACRALADLCEQS